MKFKCPICKKEAALGDPDFPFCSARCRDTDLGNWASERYVISEPTDELSQAEEAADED
jgi:uncharacterized protein